MKSNWWYRMAWTRAWFQQWRCTQHWDWRSYSSCLEQAAQVDHTAYLMLCESVGAWG